MNLTLSYFIAVPIFRSYFYNIPSSGFDKRPGPPSQFGIRVALYFELIARSYDRDSELCLISAERNIVKNNTPV